MAEKIKAEKRSEQNKVKTPEKSVKGFYHYLNKAWRKPSEELTEEIRKEMIGWRAGARITKLEKPTRLDRARALGYKAKKGILVFRVTLPRGGRKNTRPSAKRRSKRFNIKKALKMNYQWVAEQRLQKAYSNLEILNSYQLAKDGKFYFFEVIAIDPERPEIKNDKTLNWICKPENRNRTLRGLTSAGKKARGLLHKTRNLKVRPSARSWDRKGR